MANIETRKAAPAKATKVKPPASAAVASLAKKKLRGDFILVGL